MITSTTRRVFCLLMLLGASMLALAEEPRLIPYFSSKGIPTPMIRERVLEGIMAKFPKAVKLFEFHDEVRTIILLKLSDRSYATKIWGGSGQAEFVFDSEPLRLIPRTKEDMTQGQFTVDVIPSDGSEPTIGISIWSVAEKELDLRGAKKLLFSFHFPADNKKSPVGKKVTIAVDWESGRIEGVKDAPITGKEERLEP